MEAHQRQRREAAVGEPQNVPLIVPECDPKFVEILGILGAVVRVEIHAVRTQPVPALSYGGKILGAGRCVRERRGRQGVELGTAEPRLRQPRSAWVDEDHIAVGAEDLGEIRRRYRGLSRPHSALPARTRSGPAAEHLTAHARSPRQFESLYGKTGSAARPCPGGSPARRGNRSPPGCPRGRPTGHGDGSKTRVVPAAVRVQRRRQAGPKTEQDQQARPPCRIAHEDTRSATQVSDHHLGVPDFRCRVDGLNGGDCRNVRVARVNSPVPHVNLLQTTTGRPSALGRTATSPGAPHTHTVAATMTTYSPHTSVWQRPAGAKLPSCHVRSLGQTRRAHPCYCDNGSLMSRYSTTYFSTFDGRGAEP